MESIDKLRELIRDSKLLFGVAHKFYEAVYEIEREIEETIERDYMKLPVDADGVPIHVGDICTKLDERFEVRQLRTDGDAWWTIDRLGESYMANFCHHVKPRTLEDVLRDVWKEALDYAKSDIWRNPDEVFAERADEIRELLGGDAS